ncbi:unnamed protein product, partial [marine sediment metagenome]
MPHNTPIAMITVSMPGPTRATITRRIGRKGRHIMESTNLCNIRSNKGEFRP